MADRSMMDQVLALADMPSTILDVTGLGPAAVLKHLGSQLPSEELERENFWAEARMAAITGNSSKTRGSFRSGVLFSS